MIKKIYYFVMNFHSYIYLCKKLLYITHKYIIYKNIKIKIKILFIYLNQFKRSYNIFSNFFIYF